jgi:hypothetical protein
MTPDEARLPNGATIVVATLDPGDSRVPPVSMRLTFRLPTNRCIPLMSDPYEVMSEIKQRLAVPVPLSPCCVNVDVSMSVMYAGPEWHSALPATVHISRKHRWG